MEFFALILALLLYIVPIVLTILVVLWIYKIKTAAEEQVVQNRAIISILRKMQKEVENEN
ncbi:hypothetical protein QA612_09595 [Evansella sp. AB-P1]|uniref:hypothetical protein n=1 Tax=Evansella sp. AB-P1 TaxID=3037653 RepID=UPI00241F4905|nr:hypothetical protein [Evansella sp. AB-P1]MDG5787752.1 hypothetical protein [Evansella sp. AB-P1]